MEINMDGISLAILAFLLFLIFVTVYEMLDKVEHRLGEIQRILSEIKAEREGSAADKKPDSKA